MKIDDSMKPMSLGPGVEFSRQRYSMVAPGTVTLPEILACPTYFLHAMQGARFAPGIQIELSSEAGLFDALLAVESVDRDAHRVEVRVLRAYDSPRVPDAELTVGNLGVRWQQGSKAWAIVTLDSEPGVDATIRLGFPTEGIAARALAALTGKKRRQAA